MTGRVRSRPPWRCRLFGHQCSTGVLYRDSTSYCLRCGWALVVGVRHGR